MRKELKDIISKISAENVTKLVIYPISNQSEDCDKITTLKYQTRDQKEWQYITVDSNEIKSTLGQTHRTLVERLTVNLFNLLVSDLTGDCKNLQAIVGTLVNEEFAVRTWLNEKTIEMRFLQMGAA